MKFNRKKKICTFTEKEHRFSVSSSNKRPKKPTRLKFNLKRLTLLKDHFAASS